MDVSHTVDAYSRLDYNMQTEVYTFLCAYVLNYIYCCCYGFIKLDFTDLHLIFLSSILYLCVYAYTLWTHAHHVKLQGNENLILKQMLHYESGKSFM